MNTYNTMINSTKVAKRVHREPVTHAVGLRLTGEEFAAVKQAAIAEQRSMSSLARILVMQGLAQLQAQKSAG